LMARGCRVYAPALPGFGGTAELPGKRRTMEGYAAWVDAFLDTIGVDTPAPLVASPSAESRSVRPVISERGATSCDQLVGGLTGSSGQTLAALPYDRPPWEYGVHFARSLWSRDGYRVMQAMSEDLIHNVVVNPWALLEIGALARRVDLTDELSELRRREVPIVVLWGDRDGVLPLIVRRLVRRRHHGRAARRSPWLSPAPALSGCWTTWSGTGRGPRDHRHPDHGRTAEPVAPHEIPTRRHPTARRHCCGMARATAGTRGRPALCHPPLAAVRCEQWPDRCRTRPRSADVVAR
jgi:hypothetical protein